MPIVIVGEGGTSGQLFSYAADTFIRQFGGKKVLVHDGDDVVQALQEFFAEEGAITRLVYIGHGNGVGLYVNQTPNLNGALYVNDPALNAEYRAASIYELPPDLFSEDGVAEFYGCNIAAAADDTDSFAEHVANHFQIRVRAATGPTEFSFSPSERRFLTAPTASIAQDVYMVPTSDTRGFVEIAPSLKGVGGYMDVAASMAASNAIAALSARGVHLGKDQLLEPYRSMTVADALILCRAIDPEAPCAMADANPRDTIRNTAFLKLLLDAAGMKLERTTIPYQAQISFASARGLLTTGFTQRRWYTRAEGMMLTWNILRYREDMSRGLTPS